MERIRRHLTYANVAATLALVLAMSGGAVAATGGFSSGGKLQACVNEEGTLKLLKAGKHCKRGQKSVSWNQTGPSGAPGAKGATGVAGAAGAAGASGAAGAAGASASAAWARISAEGTILAGHGVVAVKLSNANYHVTFDQDISKCGAVASTSDGPTGARVGYTTFIEEPSNTVDVLTVAAQTNANAPATFTVAVFC